MLSYYYKKTCLSIWVSWWVSGYVVDRRKNNWAYHEETFTTYSLRPEDGCGQKRKLKNYGFGLLTRLADYMVRYMLTNQMRR